MTRMFILCVQVVQYQVGMLEKGKVDNMIHERNRQRFTSRHRILGFYTAYATCFYVRLLQEGAALILVPCQLNEEH